jgi:hypothetical protein
MKKCIFAILVVAIAAGFWISWWHEMQLYAAQKQTVTTMLRNQGLDHIRVFPKSEGCFTWNARKNETRIVTGKICLGD